MTRAGPDPNKGGSDNARTDRTAPSETTEKERRCILRAIVVIQSERISSPVGVARGALGGLGSSHGPWLSRRGEKATEDTCEVSRPTIEFLGVGDVVDASDHRDTGGCRRTSQIGEQQALGGIRGRGELVGDWRLEMGDGDGGRVVKLGWVKGSEELGLDWVRASWDEEEGSQWRDGGPGYLSQGLVWLQGNKSKSKSKSASLHAFSSL